jgi:hypothetical protein
MKQRASRQPLVACRKNNHPKNKKRAANTLPAEENKKKNLLEFFGQYRELQFGLGQRLDDGGFRIFR